MTSKRAKSDSPQPFKPTKEQLADAKGKTVRDVIARNLRVLFCGINPGLYTAAVGHHFARPGNRFWPALFAGGFTPRLLKPVEKHELLKLGFGITNIVNRATARADELSVEELIAGARRLKKKVRRFSPKIVAIVGITAYRVAFQRPRARLGRQNEKICDSILWVLPNPSGLNAHHQPATLAKMFRALRKAAR